MPKMKRTKLLKIREAAQFLNCSDGHLYKMAQKGLVPCCKLGKSWRFHLDVLEQFATGMLPSDVPSAPGVKDSAA